MISKKNKALTAGILAAAMSATAIVPTFASAATQWATENDANKSYASMFESLYADVITNGEANGYLSSKKNGNSFGIPYHSVETLCVEAPDYGHETTSEAMSYMAWITAMHDVLAEKGVISDSNRDLEKGWRTVEAIIPGWNKDAYGSNTKYSSIWAQDRLKADTATEEADPSLYPAKQNGVDAINPIYNEMKSAYGSDNGYYLMHWLADVDDWYGFGGGTPGAGNGQFTFINTFQRGEQESCFETVPQPCLEELKYGMASQDQDNGNGIKAIFNGINKVPKQYAFTNAPDAEDRAIQAIYFANQFGLNTGELSSLAGKMGDQCRNDMFDKYYKAIGCQDIGAQTASGKDSQHFLMAWYTSWGGALDASYGSYTWAWQIGCSHSHQFYQNPLAAYALAYDPAISAGMKTGTVAKSDYEKSVQRQIEMYLWLQSADGPFAGGCTNSKNGKYEKYDASESTFYDMVYVEHPVYADPGSNHWIGNQVWSTQRLAELYYYVKTKGDQTASGITYGGLSLEEALEKLLSRWIDWFTT
ncbi:MAG: cellulose 1,4-beta-cellobiosidase, partial [Ruminococcus sp.]|nr:cellulose 1,4-beta-cellobiosidase [Ruminococcus sp.]